MFKGNNKNTRVMSMTRFSSVSIDNFKQINISWDVSEKTDLLPNNFEISRSSYYFVSHYFIVMEFPRSHRTRKRFKQNIDH